MGGFSSADGAPSRSVWAESRSVPVTLQGSSAHHGVGTGSGARARTVSSSTVSAGARFEPLDITRVRRGNEPHGCRPSDTAGAGPRAPGPKLALRSRTPAVAGRLMMPGVVNEGFPMKLVLVKPAMASGGAPPPLARCGEACNCCSRVGRCQTETVPSSAAQSARYDCSVGIVLRLPRPPNRTASSPVTLSDGDCGSSFGGTSVATGSTRTCRIHPRWNLRRTKPRMST
mmetsp:Transcript_44418/g.137083  ORF Transcript_44418/g.137083 Transcript_44418/m.137083 type:complete len:229 (+) Transcript_44418:137-823(+)